MKDGFGKRWEASQIQLLPIFVTSFDFHFFLPNNALAIKTKTRAITPI